MRDIEDNKASIDLNFPAIHASVFAAIHPDGDGTRYLRSHGVVLIGQTSTFLHGTRKFLERMSPEFSDYLDDVDFRLTDDGTMLSKFAGQLCYLSLGKGRTKNAEAPKYFDNIKKQAHGSILEHPVYTFLLYGIDRAVTHELVRHRAGKAFSQVSQRYIGPEMLRYVMPAEMQGDEEAEGMFLEDIDENRKRYIRRIEWCMHKYPDLEGESKTDKRKRMQSFARRVLANEVEAPIVVSGNVRSWRHVISMRCGKAADRAIRAPIFDVLRILQRVNATGFSDFRTFELADGTMAAEPEFAKV